MKKLSPVQFAVAAAAAILLAGPAFADNPVITDQFTADPTARVFENKIYLYPSHDIAASEGVGRGGWFNMRDYHTFSTENGIDWKDWGIIVDQAKTDWVNVNSYAMWAPDCIFKNGKYYFYFPAPSKPGYVNPRTQAAASAPATAPSTAPATGPGGFAGGGGAGGRGRGRGGGGGGGGGSRIGVAIADHPEGPYVVQPPILGVGGIDPGMLIDPKDGSVYMFTAGGRISVSKLNPDLVSIAQGPQVIANLPTQGTIEGPFPIERNGTYYLTYPHAVTINGHEAEQLEYATATEPMGPYTVKGIMMDQTPNGAWTNHQSVVQYQGQWILFYHDKLLSPSFDKNRSVCADYLTFNDDGTIQKVVPTLRGIGIADATHEIQIDRYSDIDKAGAAVAYIDPKNTFGGWKTTFSAKDAWIRYNRVDFGKGTLKSITARTIAPAGGTLEIRLDKPDAPVLASITIPTSADWSEPTATLATIPTGQHDLFVSSPDANQVQIDWVTFK